MATMTVTEPGGQRAFAVPITELPQDGPFKTGHGELALDLEAGDRPVRLAMRFFPSTFEFQARLPALITENKLPYDPFDLAEGLDLGAPVITYTARAEVVTRIPVGLDSLGALEAYLQTTPPIFALGDYAIESIGFEPSQAG